MARKDLYEHESQNCFKYLFQIATLAGASRTLDHRRREWEVFHLWEDRNSSLCSLLHYDRGWEKRSCSIRLGNAAILLSSSLSLFPHSHTEYTRAYTHNTTLKYMLLALERRRSPWPIFAWVPLLCKEDFPCCRLRLVFFLQWGPRIRKPTRGDECRPSHADFESCCTIRTHSPASWCTSSTFVFWSRDLCTAWGAAV